MDLKFVETGVRERDVTGALVLFPLPHDEGDEVQYSELAMFIDPEMMGVEQGAAFFVQGRSGSDQYSVLDLNRLPSDVSIQITIRTPLSEHSTIFSGRNGNQPQPVVASDPGAQV